MKLVTVLDLVWIGTRGTENRSPARKDPSAAFDIENHRAVLEHALPAVAEAHELVAVVAFPFSHDGTDDSIEARTVTATGQESYAHFPAPFPTRAVSTSETVNAGASYADHSSDAAGIDVPGLRRPGARCSHADRTRVGHG